MNRLICGALIREAADGSNVAVVVGSPRTASIMFALAAREAETLIAGSQRSATVTPEAKIDFDDAGRLTVIVAGHPVPDDASLIYVDMPSVSRALGDNERDTDMLLRPLEMRGAEVIRSDGDA